jgi:hypothetical protein
MVWLDRGKKGEELLRVFTLFCYIFDFYQSLMKPPCFKEKNRKCLKYVETRWAIGRRA